MKKLMVIVFIAFALSGCGKEDKGQAATNDLLNHIWNVYVNYPDNVVEGVRYINPVGEMIKQGTVPPSAVASSADGRLPAYLACYDHVIVMSGLGDSKTDVCVYYINNPTRGTYAIMMRGKKYIDRIEAAMASDGFTPN